MHYFVRGKPFCLEMSLSVVFSALTVLLSDCITALTLGDKHVCWEPLYWLNHYKLINSYLKQSTAISNYLQLSSAISGYLWLSLAISIYVCISIYLLGKSIFMNHAIYHNVHESTIVKTKLSFYSEGL
jgi:hypothetical protein